MTKVTIRLPDDVHQALEEESERLGCSIESLIEERLTNSGLDARVAYLVEKARQSSGLDERRALATAVSETEIARMVERGLADAEAGRTISHEEMGQKLRSWGQSRVGGGN